MGSSLAAPPACAIDWGTSRRSLELRTLWIKAFEAEVSLRHCQPLFHPSISSSSYQTGLSHSPWCHHETRYETLVLGR